MTRISRLLTIIFSLGLLVPSLSAKDSFAEPVRLKDIADFANRADVRLFGYGLVVGLKGTGDGAGTEFTIQSLANMLTRLGVTVNSEQIKVKNVAAVMVTATLTPDMKTGTHFDVMVSSMGDAKSLEGGVLLLTPLNAMDGRLYAYAQGPVSTGGFNVEAEGGSNVSRNYTLVGRIPGGGVLEQELMLFNPPNGKLRVYLRDPDYTTAQRLADVINDQYFDVATPVDRASVLVEIPPEYDQPGGQVDFIASLESMTLTPDQPARVVINEKTGTIVAGEWVTIAPVALAHGSITIQIRTRPVISQPAPLSEGETVVERQSDIDVTEDEARVVYLEEATNINEVAQALNSIGATARDIISIFQALKEAGALRAELIII